MIIPRKNRVGSPYPKDRGGPPVRGWPRACRRDRMPCGGDRRRWRWTSTNTRQRSCWPVRRAGPARRPRLQPRAGGLPGARDRRRGLGGQGADPFRRARQGRRRQAVPRRARGRGRGRRAARPDAGHRADRARAARLVYAALCRAARSKWRRELYLGFVLDRKSERVMVVASSAGGMEIEEIAHEQARDADPRRGRARGRHAGVPGARDRLRAGPGGRPDRTRR